MKQAFIVCILGLLIGCNVEYTTDDFIKSQRYQNEQEFKMIGNNDTILTGIKGTLIHLPKDIVKNINPTDTIKVKLAEYYNKSEMIFAGLSTTSNDRILDSKGMICIELFRNSTKIERINKPISVKFIENTDYVDYQIFNGQVLENTINWTPDTITANYRVFLNNRLTISDYFQINNDRNFKIPIGKISLDSILWTRNYTKIDSIITYFSGEQIDTIYYGDIYTEAGLEYSSDIGLVYNSLKINWINLDKFLDFENITTLEISSNKKSNVKYFCVFQNYKSIISLSESIENINVPIGEKITLIGLSIDKNNHYFDIKSDITISLDMKIKLELKDTDLELIKAKIKKLN